MKLKLTILLLMLGNGILAQKPCSCIKNPEVTEFVRDNSFCDPTVLSNGAILSYHLNCDSIWLDLVQRTGATSILYSAPLEATTLEYNYRIGYQFIKEFERDLLFEFGCPANGPCNHILVNKTTGIAGAELGEIIYSPQSSWNNFIVSFAESSKDTIVLHYINSGKKYIIPVNGKNFTELIPEKQFDSLDVEGDILIMRYFYRPSEESDLMHDQITINLKKYPEQ